MATGYTNLANPFSGIRENSEPEREIYVEDDVFESATRRLQ